MRSTYLILRSPHSMGIHLIRFVYWKFGEDVQVKCHIRFLGSITHCNNNPSWLMAFASRVVVNQTIRNYVLFSFRIRNGEQLCKGVNYRAILPLVSGHNHSTRYVYSNAKGILHKLKKGKSVDVTNNYFWKHILLWISKPRSFNRR